MERYYVAFQTRSQAFLMEQRLKNEGIACELTYMPREIMRDLCNMGVRFGDSQYEKAVQVIRRSGLPGCRIYKETVYPKGSKYTEVPF
jgi:hypothetical protein